MHNQRFLSVSELNHLLNLTLEEQIGVVAFEGEICELTRPGSGHLYITLKDDRGEVRIVLWASTVRTLRFTPATGMSVRCSGKPNVYARNGRLQIVVYRMEPAGEGELQKKFLDLKAKLEREGLFDVSRKRPLPAFPRAVGVVTSASGAVIHDIMVKARERMPQIPIYLVDVRVQGDGSAQEIASAIRYLNEHGVAEVLIVGRGGGSLEDLWAFNEEVVVRAIFASKIPIVSAVGHEADISLSDLVADVRAPTPTAAAEMVLPKRADLLRSIADYERRLLDYHRWLGPLSQRVDELGCSLAVKMRAALGAARLRYDTARARLQKIEPHSRLRELREKVEGQEYRMRLSLDRKSGESRLRLDNLARRLESVSPKRVLERGFSIVRAGDRIIRSSESLSIGDRMKISFAVGSVRAEVKAKD